MKRIIAAMAALAVSVGCFAQDMIVKKDGSIIQAKVSEIGTSEVKYKKWSNQNGPSYAIAKSDILAINYQNGEKDTFENSNSSTSDSTPKSPQMVSKKASPNNATLILKYGKTHTPVIKAKNNVADRALGIFAFDEKSVISNEDIEMTLVPSTAASPLGRNDLLRFRYCIQIKNNTDKTIYIDLANSLRINEKRNEIVCFYDSETISVTTGNSSGAAMNMGGITGALGIGGVVGNLARATTVAGGSSSSVQRNFSQQQIVTIPPHSTKKITDFKLVKTEKASLLTAAKITQVQRGEELIFGFKWVGPEYFNDFGIEYRPSYMKKGEIKLGEAKLYSVDDSPIVFDYTISYSTDPTFAEYSILTPKLYLKEMYGVTIKDVRLETNDLSLPLKILPSMDAYTILGYIFFEK